MGSINSSTILVSRAFRGDVTSGSGELWIADELKWFGSPTTQSSWSLVLATNSSSSPLYGDDRLWAVVRNDILLRIIPCLNRYPTSWEPFMRFRFGRSQNISGSAHSY